MRRPFFKYQKNYLSQNIVIGLMLKTVHWTMFSLNAIGLERKFLNEIVKSEKKEHVFATIFFSVLYGGCAEFHGHFMAPRLHHTDVKH